VLAQVRAGFLREAVPSRHRATLPTSVDPTNRRGNPVVFPRFVESDVSLRRLREKPL
jgi:hypothetical protein